MLHYYTAGREQNASLTPQQPLWLLHEPLVAKHTAFAGRRILHHDIQSGAVHRAFQIRQNSKLLASIAGVGRGGRQVAASGRFLQPRRRRRRVCGRGIGRIFRIGFWRQIMCGKNGIGRVGGLAVGSSSARGDVWRRRAWRSTLRRFRMKVCCDLPVIAASIVFFASVLAISMLGSVVPSPPATGTAAAAAGMQRGRPLARFSRTENKRALRYICITLDNCLSCKLMESTSCSTRRLCWRCSNCCETISDKTVCVRNNAVKAQFSPTCSCASMRSRRARSCASWLWTA
jgi:hypothetical protein